MNDPKNIIPDEFQAEFERALAESVLQYGYLTPSDIRDCLEVQGKLKENGLPKTLEEMFVYKNVLPDVQLQDLQKFVVFLKKRLLGISLCQIGIDAKIFSQNDLEYVLITQRAFFELKKLPLDLLDLLETKGKLSSEKREKIMVRFESAGHDKAAFQKTMDYLKKEDDQSRTWRAQHSKGIVGVKYASPRQEPKASLSWLFKKGEKEPKAQEVPPSRLERETVRIFKPAKGGAPTGAPAPQQPGQSMNEALPGTLASMASDIPGSPPSSLESVPPSALESGLPEEGKDKECLNVEMREYELGEIDATEAIQSPHGLASSRSTLKAFLITALLCLMATLLFSFWGRKEVQLYKQIESLRANKKYQELEEKCREFCLAYPVGERHEKVTRFLAEVLTRRADISHRQGNAREAFALISESLRLYEDQETRGLAQEIEKEFNESERQEKFNHQLARIEEFIRQKKFHKARSLLGELQQSPEYEKRVDALDGIAKQLKVAEDSDKVLRYRYYPYAELSPTESFSSESTQEEGIFRMPLKGLEVEHEVPLAEEGKEEGVHTSHFFTIAAGHLYALKASDGSVEWLKYLGGSLSFTPLFLAGPREYFNMALVEKVLVVAPHRNALQMLQAKNGQLIWQTVLPGVIVVQPVLCQNKLFVGCLDRHCYQIDVISGAIEGAYLAGSIPKQPPTFDKRKKWMYLPCNDRIYVYEQGSGKLVFTIPASELAAPVLPVSSYIVLFSSQKGSSTVSFYAIEEQRKEWKTKSLKSFSLPGTILTPPVLAGGMLAVSTDSHFGVYGVNPINPEEAFFPISTVSLPERGPVFLQFNNFMRNLSMLQKEFVLYEIQDFSSSSDAMKKCASHAPSVKLPLKTVLPLQRCDNFYFWAQQDESEKYFQINCLRMDRGTITSVWERQLASGVSCDPLKTEDGRLFFQTQEGHLHEVYLVQGKICCRTIAHETGNGSTPPLYIQKNAGYLLLVNKDGMLSLLDGVTGWPLRWKTEVPLKGEISRIGYKDDTVFVGASRGVFAFGLRDGRKRYLEYSEFKGKPFASNPVFYKNSLFVGCDNGTLYEFRPASNDSSPFLQNVWSFKTRQAIRSEPLNVENRLYFGSDDHRLYALDIQERQLLWEYETQGPVCAKPAMNEGILYFGSDDRRFYALDEKTGKLLWSKSFFGKIRTSPLIQKGRVYVASLAGELEVCEARSGKTIFRTQLGGSIVSSPVSLDKYVLIGGSDGFIYILETP